MTCKQLQGRSPLSVLSHGQIYHVVHREKSNFSNIHTHVFFLHFSAHKSELVVNDAIPIVKNREIELL